MDDVKYFKDVKCPKCGSANVDIEALIWLRGSSVVEDSITNPHAQQCNCLCLECEFEFKVNITG